MKLCNGIITALLALVFAVLMPSFAAAHELHDHHHAGSSETAEVEALDRPTIDELVGQFRRTGDDGYLDAAWAMLEPRLESGNQDPGLLLDAATVAQSRHEFTRALDLTRRALELTPRNDQGWLLLASIHLVRGETDAAASACRRLRDSALLVTLTCQARVAVARNEIEPARQRLQAVLDVLDATTVSPGILAWALSVAGDLSASDHPAEAILYYRASLQHAESTQVRAALVDVLLSAGRLADASAALDAGSDALPLAVRQLIVDKRLGKLGPDSPVVAVTDRRFRRWMDADDWLHAREMARFYIDVVDKPELARKLATINIELQKEPEDLRLERRTRAIMEAAG